MTSVDSPIETLEPPIPTWLFPYVINPFMRAVLRSPVHGLLSDHLVLITVTGRRSGRKFTTPVGYESLDGFLYITSQTNRTWWRNLREGADVELRLKGERREGHAAVIEDNGDVASYVEGFVDRHGLDAISRLALKVDGETLPNREVLAAGLEETVIVRIDLDAS